MVCCENRVLLVMCIYYYSYYPNVMQDFSLTYCATGLINKYEF